MSHGGNWQKTTLAPSGLPSTPSPMTAAPETSGSLRGAGLWTSAGPTPASGEPAPNGSKQAAMCSGSSSRPSSAGRPRPPAGQPERQHVAARREPGGDGRGVAGELLPAAGADDEDLVKGDKSNLCEAASGRCANCTVLRADEMPAASRWRLAGRVADVDDLAPRRGLPGGDVVDACCGRASRPPGRSRCGRSRPSGRRAPCPCPRGTPSAGCTGGCSRRRGWAGSRRTRGFSISTEATLPRLPQRQTRGHRDAAPADRRRRSLDSVSS